MIERETKVPEEVLRGRVFKIEKGMVHVLIEEGMEGQRMWFEPLGGYDIEIDDVISGNLWSLGGEELTNETKNYKMDVFIQDHT